MGTTRTALALAMPTCRPSSPTAASGRVGDVFEGPGALAPSRDLSRFTLTALSITRDDAEETK